MSTLQSFSNTYMPSYILAVTYGANGYCVTVSESLGAVPVLSLAKQVNLDVVVTYISRCTADLCTYDAPIKISRCSARYPLRSNVYIENIVK